jgi:murein DD-endopeptidase MepM/ murein hydrolase activator NlpD
MHIELQVPRPLLTLSLIGAVAGFFVWSNADALPAEGGSGTVQAEVVRDAEQEVRELRQEQDVLDRRESILRAELEQLEWEQRTNNDPTIEAEMREARTALIALIEDKQAGEAELLSSLRQIWEAQGYAQMASRGHGAGGTIQLMWPVEPLQGISAYFNDDGYQARFGIPHHAIDIPAPQETVIAAAADGTVEKVSDNGMGFSSIVIRHKNGFATMYGHVSGFLVSEGDEVYAGDAIALSGGRPGTKGAGRMTTGAHVHLELTKDGQQVDPLTYLPTF